MVSFRALAGGIHTRTSRWHCPPRLRQENTLPELLRTVGTHKRKVVVCFRLLAVLTEVIECLSKFVEPSLGYCTPGSNPQQRSCLMSIHTPMKKRGSSRAGVFEQKPQKCPSISDWKNWLTREHHKRKKENSNNLKTHEKENYDAAGKWGC